MQSKWYKKMTEAMREHVTDPEVGKIYRMFDFVNGRTDLVIVTVVYSGKDDKFKFRYLGRYFEYCISVEDNWYALHEAPLYNTPVGKELIRLKYSV